MPICKCRPQLSRPTDKPDSLKIRQDRDLLPANIGIPCVPKVTGS